MPRDSACANIFGDLKDMLHALLQCRHALRVDVSICPVFGTFHPLLFPPTSWTYVVSARLIRRTLTKHSALLSVRALRRTLLRNRSLLIVDDQIHINSADNVTFEVCYCADSKPAKLQSRRQPHSRSSTCKSKQTWSAQYPT